MILSARMCDKDSNVFLPQIFGFRRLHDINLQRKPIHSSQRNRNINQILHIGSPKKIEQISTTWSSYIDTAFDRSQGRV
jgi:hypothetical protein